MSWFYGFELKYRFVKRIGGDGEEYGSTCLTNDRDDAPLGGEVEDDDLLPFRSDKFYKKIFILISSSL